MAVNPAYALAFLQMLAATPVGADSPAVYNQIGILYCRRNNFDAAKKAFLRAARNANREPVVILNVARFFDYHTSAARTAAKLYREFIRLSNGRNELAELRGSAQARLRAIEPADGR